jgi:putative PIN family toxin of toxin-antitoxin system
LSVTLDTNIYVSGLEFGGIGPRLVGAARAGLIVIDISDAILRELVSVLRDDFHWDGYRLHFLQQQLRKICHHVTPKTALKVLQDDPDNRILECAVEAASEVIVTEDKDLLTLKIFEGIPIVRAREFLALDRPIFRHFSVLAS